MMKSLPKNGAKPASIRIPQSISGPKLGCYGSFGGVQEWLPRFLLKFFSFSYVFFKKIEV